MTPTGETIFWQASPIPNPQAPSDAKPLGLPELTHDASIVLYTLSSIFPFDLFPDKIIIRVNHIDIVHGIFFWSGTTDRLQVMDIRDVSVEYNPFFAKIKITPVGEPNMVLSVRFLWRSQAIRAKRILLGLLECHRQQIDLSKYAPNELLPSIEKIGRARSSL